MYIRMMHLRSSRFGACSRSYGVLLWADVRSFTVLGWLYLLSYFKLFVTSTKYVPQARLQRSH